MNVVLNGDVVAEDSVAFSFTDRAFQYGDGLFETIRYEKGNVFFWSDHLDRLTRGMQALSLRFQAYLNPDSLLPQIYRLLEENQLSEGPARIKLQVWRQTGGLYTPTQEEANYLLSARPGLPFSFGEKKKVDLYEAVRLSHSPVSAFKTLSALPYVLAGLANRQRGTDDLILLDTEGHLAECLASNLFWLRDRTLFTPSLATGCIDGVLRRQLLRLAPGSGFSVQEGRFHLPSLLDAEAVFCGNVMGIQVIRQVAGKEFGIGGIDQVKDMLNQFS